MKKEIEITFGDSRATLKENLIIGIYINGVNTDEITLQNDCVLIGADIHICSILGIEDYLSLEEYISIPEIKALHDERFKKEVDLFEFLEVNKHCFSVTQRGFIECRVIKSTMKEYIEELAKNYNLFPSEETCTNAIPMSLDERKQYLFAIAKGYEVLTFKEMIRDYGTEENPRNIFEILYDADVRLYRPVANLCSYSTSGICFKEEKHAEECADFMNGKEGV